MRPNLIAAIALSCTTTFLCAAQKISPVTAGATRLEITTSPAKAGDTIRIYVSKTSMPSCILGTPLPLLADTNDAVGAGAVTPVELGSPLTAGEYVCAVTTSPDGTTVHQGKDVEVGAAPAPAPAAPVLPIVTPPAAGDDTLAITTAPAKKGDPIAVFAPAKSSGECAKGKSLPLDGDNPVGADTKTVVLMKGKFTSGQFVCVVIAGKYTSAVVAVADAKPVAPPTPGAPAVDFQGVPTAGSKSLMLTGSINPKAASPSTPAPTTPATPPAAKPAAPATPAPSGSSASTVNVSVYAFSPSTIFKNGCDKDSIKLGTPLSIATSSTSTDITAPAGSASPYSLSLDQPLAEGVQLCAVATADPGGVPGYSPQPAIVTNSTDYGHFRAIFTAGAMVNNQQSSANSSTAGEFLDMELLTALMRAGRRPCTTLSDLKCSHSDDKTKPCASLSDPNCFRGARFTPGFNLSFNARLSPISVATTTTTTTTTTKTTTTGNPPTTSASTSSDLNLLTSQQGLRVLIGADLPFRTGGWNHRTYAIMIGPLAKASFDTVLNPSVNSNSSSTATSTTQTTGSFSSVYSSWAAGGRVGWNQFPANTDQAPRLLGAFDVVLGQYSNFSSFECVAAPKGSAPPTGTTTNCGNATGAFANSPNVSRVLIPRLDIAGFITFPGFPVTLGFDANLAEYGLPHLPTNIDTANKPGNDIRIYVGYTIDFSSAVKNSFAATIKKMTGQ